MKYVQGNRTENNSINDFSALKRQQEEPVFQRQWRQCWGQQGLRPCCFKVLHLFSFLAIIKVVGINSFSTKKSKLTLNQFIFFPSEENVWSANLTRYVLLIKLVCIKCLLILFLNVSPCSVSLILEHEVSKAISAGLKCPQFALHGQCAPRPPWSLLFEAVK